MLELDSSTINLDIRSDLFSKGLKTNSLNISFKALSNIGFIFNNALEINSSMVVELLIFSFENVLISNSFKFCVNSVSHFEFKNVEKSESKFLSSDFNSDGI